MANRRKTYKCTKFGAKREWGKRQITSVSLRKMAWITAGAEVGWCRPNVVSRGGDGGKEYKEAKMVEDL